MGGILDKAFSKRGLKKRIKENQIFVVWKDAVGESIAKNCQPVDVNNGVLTLEAKSNAWLQELSFLGEEIRGEINRAMGWEAIKSLRFRVGDLSRPEEFDTIDVVEKPKKIKPQIDKGTAAEIEKHIEGIKDPELREALKGLMARGAGGRRK